MEYITMQRLKFLDPLRAEVSVDIGPGLLPSGGFRLDLNSWDPATATVMIIFMDGINATLREATEMLRVPLVVAARVKLEKLNVERVVVLQENRAAPFVEQFVGKVQYVKPV